MSENVIGMRKKLLKKALENSGETMKSFLAKRIKELNQSEDKTREELDALDDVSGELLIDFYARMPKPAFDRALAAISGIDIPEEEVDPKAKIMAWLNAENIDIRKVLKEKILEVIPPEDHADEEVKMLKSVLSEGTDEEVRQLFVDLIEDNEEQTQKMLGFIEFTEIFTKEASPMEMREEELLAEVVMAKTPEIVPSDEFQKRVNAIFGYTPAAEETEDELIDKLNRLEYKRDESDKFEIVQKVSPASRQDLEKSIREIKGRLINIQGGTLDRFGLRNRSAVELESLIEAIQDEIDELKVNKAQTDDAINKLAEHFKAPPGLSDLFTPTPNRYQLYIKKRLLSELKMHLRLKQTPVKGDTPQDRAARVAVEIQEMNETITLLEQQCEAEVRKYPGREVDIRRRYRRAIDAMKETT